MFPEPLPGASHHAQVRGYRKIKALSSHRVYTPKDERRNQGHPTLAVVNPTKEASERQGMYGDGHGHECGALQKKKGVGGVWENRLHTEEGEKSTGPVDPTAAHLVGTDNLNLQRTSKIKDPIDN